MELSLHDLDEIKSTNKDYIKVACCPFCEERVNKVDTKFHLSINTTKKRFQCFRCGATGVLVKQNLISEVKADKFKRKSKISLNDIEYSIDLDEFSEIIDPGEHPLSYQYLISRKFTDDEIGKYQIRTGKSYIDKDGKTNSRWRGRIIFPYIENGKCLYAVGRTYNNIKPKYYNTWINKSNIVYGINNIKNNEVILCEGIISAIMAEKYTGVSAVSCLGKSPMSSQLDILRLKCNKVYLCLDGEVSKEERDKTKSLLLKKNFIVYETVLPIDKDPDDLQEEFLEYFNKSIKISRR